MLPRASSQDRRIELSARECPHDLSGQAGSSDDSALGVVIEPKALPGLPLSLREDGFLAGGRDLDQLLLVACRAVHGERSEEYGLLNRRSVACFVHAVRHYDIGDHPADSRGRRRAVVDVAPCAVGPLGRPEPGMLEGDFPLAALAIALTLPPETQKTPSRP